MGSHQEPDVVKSLRMSAQKTIFILETRPATSLQYPDFSQGRIVEKIAGYFI
jgi:hypothetical protein